MQAFEKLEVEWAEFNELDPRGMVACSSGTSALHLALESFQLPKNSAVLCPDYTMIACPRAVTLAGLKPRFVDCGSDLLMDDGSESKNGLGEKSSNPYAAGMFVHVYGRRPDMDWISSSVGTCHPVIEDLAETHGVRPHETTDAACWSFYKNKIVAGEEGGAVWFRDPDHAKLAGQLRTLGFTDAHDYTHIPRGHNYRMSNLHAEPILKSLKSYSGCWHCGGKGYHKPQGTDRRGDPVGGGRCGICHGKTGGNVERRREIESWYESYCPKEWRMPTRDAVWVYDVRIPGLDPTSQKRIVDALRGSGIEARYGFKPCRLQKEYKRLEWEIQSDADGKLYEWESDRASREVIYMPCQPGVTTKDDTRRTFKIIQSVLEL